MDGQLMRGKSEGQLVQVQGEEEKQACKSTIYCGDEASERKSLTMMTMSGLDGRRANRLNQAESGKSGL